jgi:hypothetical protein
MEGEWGAVESVHGRKGQSVMKFVVMAEDLVR